MVVKRVIEKMFKILTNPRLFWQRYNFDSLTEKDLFGRIFPLQMSAFFLIVLFGTALNRMPETGFWLSLISSLDITILFSVSVLIVNNLAYKLCGFYVDVNYVKSSVFVFVGMLPFFIVYALLTVFPSLFFFGIFGFYALYVMYFGALYFLKVPNDNILLFLILSVILVVTGFVVAGTIHVIIMDMFSNLLG